MFIRAATALCSLSMFVMQPPTLAQTDDAASTPQPTGLCRDYQASIGPELDQLLVDTDPAKALQVTYQSAIRVNLLAAACASAPETNAYASQTAPVMARLKTELAADTTTKCNAMGTDLFNQLKGSAALVTRAPDRLKITTDALRRVNSLLISDCPEELTEPLNQVNENFDHFDMLAAAWPACRERRSALSDAIKALSLELQDPTIDPAVARSETFAPALSDFRQHCALETNWMADLETAITNIDIEVEARTPLARTACRSALSEAAQRLDAINARSAAYTPGCDLFELFEYTQEDDKRTIEVALNSTCTMFGSAAEPVKTRYQRELRLMEELDAEDRTMRYRLDQEDPDAVVCEQ